MLWELKQTESRLDEIEQEMRKIAQDRSLTVRARETKIQALNTEHTTRYIIRQTLLSKIHRDPALSKAREQDLKSQQARPVPEAERGLPEQDGQPTTTREDRRTSLRMYMAEHRAKSIGQKTLEHAKLLEQQRDPEWEPDS